MQKIKHATHFYQGSQRVSDYWAINWDSWLHSTFTTWLQYAAMGASTKTYSIIHKCCINVVRNILNQKFPVGWSPTCLCIGWNNDQGCKWSAITFSATTSTRTLKTYLIEHQLTQKDIIVLIVLRPTPTLKSDPLPDNKTYHVISVSALRRHEKCTYTDERREQTQESGLQHRGKLWGHWQSTHWEMLWFLSNIEEPIVWTACW